MEVFQIVTATDYHVRELCAQTLRPFDVAEWEAGLGVPVKWALRDAMASPALRVARAILSGGKTIGIFGVSDMELAGKTVGGVWILGAEGGPRGLGFYFFLYHAREIALLHHLGGPKLVAVADARNAMHHRWLKTMGFTELDRGPYGADPGVTFILYGRSKA